MANPYRVQLLNDLHDHFPELLYNHERFVNVSDVLGYINDVVRINRQHHAYHYYRQEYTTWYQQRHMNDLYRNSIMNDAPPHVVPSHPESTLEPSQSLSQSLSQHPSQSLSQHSAARRTYESHMESLPDLLSLVQAPRIQAPRVEAPRVQAPRIQTHYISLGGNALSNLVEQFFQDIIPPMGDLEDVPIIPTAEHLRNNTTVRQLDADIGDNCAICQDPLTATQEVRTINHCQHMFHMQCIDTWFQRNIHCPCCRHDIREASVR